jgi:quercetin dioxygenase-like cupin family protein
VGTGRRFFGPGDQVTFLITGAESNGAMFVGETLVPPGGGPPPHIHHREEESFFLLEGTLALTVGTETLQASAGDFVHLPRGIMHTFKNTGDRPARMLIIVTPAGIEKFFEEVFDPAVEGEAPRPMSQEMLMRLLAAAPKFGLELLPPA